MTSPSHDAVVQYFLLLIANAQDAQEKLENTKKLLSWVLGTGLESKCKNGTKSNYIADITVHNLFNNPLIIFEYTFAQSRKEALAKITTRLADNPKLLGACVISILESPKYKTPDRDSTMDDALFMPLWMEAVEGSPELGPINYRGFCWVGSVTCSLDVRLRGEHRPRTKNIVSLFYAYSCSADLSLQQSIIPQSDSGDLQASAALTDLWRLLVKGVAGEDVVPVPFVVDWDKFRLVLGRSLGRTAHWRFLDWNRNRVVEDNKLQAELEGKQQDDIV
jgi:hypothetical protein